MIYDFPVPGTDTTHDDARVSSIYVSFCGLFMKDLVCVSSINDVITIDYSRGLLIIQSV